MQPWACLWRCCSLRRWWTISHPACALLSSSASRSSSVRRPHVHMHVHYCARPSYRARTSVVRERRWVEPRGHRRLYHPRGESRARCDHSEQRSWLQLQRMAHWHWALLGRGCLRCVVADCKTRGGGTLGRASSCRSRQVHDLGQRRHANAVTRGHGTARSAVAVALLGMARRHNQFGPTRGVARHLRAGVRCPGRLGRRASLPFRSRLVLVVGQRLGRMADHLSRAPANNRLHCLSVSAGLAWCRLFSCLESNYPSAAQKFV